MSAFPQIFQMLIGHEGGYSTVQNDPGNWTGGKVGVGVLKGTKFGISAASYPNVDIANLTLDKAMAIYATDYWLKIHGDQLNPALALLVFDSAVNNGVGNATRFLQESLGIVADGDFGPGTLAAVLKDKRPGADQCAEFLARRLVFMSSIAIWHEDALGFARRLCQLPYQSVQVGMS